MSPFVGCGSVFIQGIGKGFCVGFLVEVGRTAVCKAHAQELIQSYLLTQLHKHVEFLSNPAEIGLKNSRNRIISCRILQHFTRSIPRFLSQDLLYRT